MKRHLFTTIGSHVLNVDEMCTVLAKIEVCVNSRPLTSVTSDPNDFTALTPSHFLTQQCLFEVPDDNTEEAVGAEIKATILTTKESGVLYATAAKGNPYNNLICSRTNNQNKTSLTAL